MVSTKSQSWIVPLTSFACKVTNELDFESAMDESVQRSMRPLSNPESTIGKKKRRFELWATDPSAAEKEVMMWERKAARAREDCAQFEAEKVSWQDSCLVARRALVEAHQRTTDANNVMCSELKQLYSLCAAELALTAGGKPKRGVRLSDIAAELSTRQAAVEARFAQIDKMAQGRGASRGSLPVLQVTVRELNYPEDLAWGRPAKSKTPASLQTQNVIESKEDGDSNHARNGKDHASSGAEDSSSSVQSGKVGAAEQLAAICAELEESVRSSELALKDLDMFFAPDRDADDLALLDSVLHTSLSGAQTNGSSAAVHAEEVAKAYVSLSRSEANCAAYLNGLFESHSAKHGAGTVTRKKKKSAELAVPLRAGVRPRTEHGIALLLSPLSQYEDRMLGTLNTESVFVPSSGSRGGFSSKLHLPQELVAAENDAMERCRLQSAAAAAELRISQLKQSNTELKIAAINGANSLRRIQQLHRQTLQEDEAERARIRKELVYYGVAQAHESEPPLSPMSFMAQQGGPTHGSNKNGKSGNSRNRNGNGRSTGGSRSGLKNAPNSVVPALPTFAVEPPAADLPVATAVKESNRRSAGPVTFAAEPTIEPAVLPADSSKRRSSGRNAAVAAVAEVAAAVAAEEKEDPAPASGSPSKTTRPRRRNI